MTQKEILMTYIFNRRIYLENEIQQLRDNVRFRHVDSVDCLELIIATERLNMFNEVAKDIEHIMKLRKGIPQKNNKGKQ